MTTTTSKWFETTIRYDRMQDNGVLKTVNELYTVDALSFTEAESRIISGMAEYISGEFQVTKITIAPYKEVLRSDEEADDKFYRVKTVYITIDEKTDKERKMPVVYLVQSESLGKAKKYIDDYLGNTMIDYTIESVVETKILDIFVHNSHK